jgi:DNA recombination-dependent growth factor C
LTYLFDEEPDIMAREEERLLPSSDQRDRSYGTEAVQSDIEGESAEESKKDDKKKFKEIWVMCLGLSTA